MHTHKPFEIQVYRNYPNCGEAWQLGGLEATGDYIHFSADDLEPQEGWLEPLLESCAAGKLPAPSVFRPDGTYESCGGMNFGVNLDLLPDWTEVEFTPVPFITREWWDAVKPIPPIHYCTDVWVSYRARRRADARTVVRPQSKFTHYHEMAGRGAGMEQNDRAYVDRLMFDQYMRNWE